MFCIVATSALNLMGLRESTRTQNALTVLEIAGILAIVYTGLGAWVGVAVLACGFAPLAWDACRAGAGRTGLGGGFTGPS